MLGEKCATTYGMKASRFASLLLAAALCTGAFAQNVVGSWNGKIDMSQYKPKDANEKKMVDQMKTFMTSMKIKLTLKADHTYLFEGTGGPANSKPQIEKGKWSQSGRTVTAIDPKGKKQNMTVSADGRTMVAVPGPEDHAPKGMRFVFTRI